MDDFVFTKPPLPDASRYSNVGSAHHAMNDCVAAVSTQAFQLKPAEYEKVFQDLAAWAKEKADAGDLPAQDARYAPHAPAPKKRGRPPKNA